MKLLRNVLMWKAQKLREKNSEGYRTKDVGKGIPILANLSWAAAAFFCNEMVDIVQH